MILSAGTATATFVPQTLTKSGSTNLPEGTVHVYRESNSKPRPSFEASTSTTSAPPVVENVDDIGGTMLAVLAVPAWMTPSDFLTFVAPAAEGISHLRMIRQDSINLFPHSTFMVLAEIPRPIGQSWSLIFRRQLLWLNSQKPTMEDPSIRWR